MNPAIEQKAPARPKHIRSMHSVQTPILLVAIIALTIFIAEIMVMFIISLFPTIGAITQAFLDGFLLILFLLPCLYFLSYRPTKNQINALVLVQNQLQSEVTERKLVEEALRQSEKFLRIFSSRLLSDQEKERKYLSIELHEALAQDLAALSIRLMFIEQVIEKSQPSLKRECEQNLKAIRQIIGNVTRLSGWLAPIEIKHGNLRIALRELADNLFRNSGIKVSLQIIDLDRLFPPETQTAMYRIVQEAISNVEKHSHATHLWVIAEQQSGHISFSVQDDGIGFNKEDVLKMSPSERGFGLATMEERLEMLGGSLNIWSQPGKGTTITLKIPFK